MFSYTKSLIAVALALLAVVGAGLWFRSGVIKLHELTKARDEMRIQMAGRQASAALINDYEKHLDALNRDIKKMTRKFAGQDFESPQLVQAVVKLASSSGLEMTDASKQERKAESLPIQGQGQKVSVLTHEITLKGSYTGLVKFMQSLAAWEMGFRLESIEIAPAKESQEEGAVEVTIMLAVYALELISDHTIR